MKFNSGNLAMVVLALFLSGCLPTGEDSDSSPSVMIITPQRVEVGPWVTCVDRPLCSEYLARDHEAWSDIYHSCRKSSDGRMCPSDLQDRVCRIEYADGSIARRLLYADSAAIPAVEFTRLCNRLGGR